MYPYFIEHHYKDYNTVMDTTSLPNENIMTNLLNSKSYTKNDIDDAFKLAVAQNNISIIRLLLKHNPKVTIIDETLMDAIHEGTNPELIYLLQNYCSLQLVPSIHWRNKSEKLKMYVVGPIEDDFIKTLDKRKEYIEQKIFARNQTWAILSKDRQFVERRIS